MRYLEARFRTEQRETIYRIYVTDSLYAIARGLTVTDRYANVINLAPEKPKDTRTQEEIVKQVWKGIKGGG